MLCLKYCCFREWHLWIWLRWVPKPDSRLPRQLLRQFSWKLRSQLRKVQLSCDLRGSKLWLQFWENWRWSYRSKQLDVSGSSNRPRALFLIELRSLGIGRPRFSDLRKWVMLPSTYFWHKRADHLQLLRCGWEVEQTLRHQTSLPNRILCPSWSSDWSTWVIDLPTESDDQSQINPEVLRFYQENLTIKKKYLL